MITYFQKRIPGPEARVEDAVAEGINDLFLDKHRPNWVAASLKIGAGSPDLLGVSFSPAVTALADSIALDAGIMAYLHTIRWARQDTIATKLRQPIAVVVEQLDRLVSLNIVSTTDTAYFIAPQWRSILSEVICVEAKVHKWKDAINQATRNQIFSHRSYVAMPEKIAQRIKNECAFTHFGIGLLSVRDDSSVYILRSSKTSSPKVWFYYYQVAIRLANDISRS